VLSPGGAELLISFLPNNEVFVTVPTNFKLVNEPALHRINKERHEEDPEYLEDIHAKRRKVELEPRVQVELGSLPWELHRLISTWLPFKTLGRLNEVCRFWKVAMDDVLLWRNLYIAKFGPLFI